MSHTVGTKKRATLFRKSGALVAFKKSYVVFLVARNTTKKSKPMKAINPTVTQPKESGQRCMDQEEPTIAIKVAMNRVSVKTRGLIIIGFPFLIDLAGRFSLP